MTLMFILEVILLISFPVLFVFAFVQYCQLQDMREEFAELDHIASEAWLEGFSTCFAYVQAPEGTPVPKNPHILF